jgi:hypothetical protein
MPEHSIIPTNADIRDNMLWVHLSDGRVIGTPLDWYPFLLAASPEQRQHIRLKRHAIWWDDLDEGLSIAGMLSGVNPRQEQAFDSEALTAPAMTAIP